MWILECEGSSLQGRRLWLRPGKKYLFGRTKPEIGRHVSGFVIRHKTVSRKHLTLAVAAVEPGDGSRVTTRPQISIRDEATKFGTKVDGTALKGDGNHVLGNEEHTFTLGSCEDVFHLKWSPVVLSFSFASKELKNGKDPLVAIRSRVEDLSIKTVLPFVEATTHVVATKRNTAKGLQALISGRYVVDMTFLDAIEYATTPSNLDEPESVSPLEEDFDRHWPDAMKYVPPPGREPDPRPVEMFAPDARRKDVFKALAFVFCEKRQLESLEAAVTSAGAKAVYYSKLTAPYTTASDLANALTQASERGKRTALLVKFTPDKGHEHWAEKLQIDVALRSRRKVIEQNEFLDAILTCEPQKLIRRTSSDGAAADEEESLPPISEHDTARSDNASSQKSELVDLPKKPRIRGVVRSAFKGFDDGFDATQIRPDREPSAPAAEAPSSNLRKRTRSPTGASGLEDDSFLPATAALKKRRLFGDLKESIDNPSTQHGEHTQASTVDSKSPQKKREFDIQQAVRERRQAEEEAARRAEEQLHQTLSDMSFEEMNHLARVEEMVVRESAGGVEARAQQASARWDPRWNGRKNFKRFRRAGADAEGASARRARTVIVPLEEAKRRGRGVGEHYWLEGSAAGRKRSGGISTTNGGRDEGSGAPLSPSHQTFESAQSYQGDEEAEQHVPAELLDPGQDAAVVDVNEPRTTRHGGAPPSLKRQASSTGRGGAAGKKQRTFAVRDESDSEDELKFRIRRK